MELTYGNLSLDQKREVYLCSLGSMWRIDHLIERLADLGLEVTHGIAEKLCFDCLGRSSR